MDKQYLTEFLNDNQESIVEEWQQEISRRWNKGGEYQFDEEQLGKQFRTLYSKIIEEVPNAGGDNGSWELNGNSGLIQALNETGAIWASRGLKASQTSHFILALKYVVLNRLGDSAGSENRDSVGRLFDELLVICHEAFTDNREKLIRQQSSALIELSSPVVKMWDQMLLVPLIGVIDTSRARKITESLLTEISEQEALIAVLDMTGVPVFDTAVAGHMMKTIKAAQMLGCQVIMTGISPEGALVLTKLGISFDDVVTCGNLHRGVREGFRRLNVDLGSAPS